MEVLDIERLKLISMLLPIIAKIGEPSAADKAAAVEPLRWFIDYAAAPKGLPLTAKGNVGVKVVQAADDLFEWYAGRWHGWKPRSDQDLGEVIALREMTTRLRLVRKQRNALLATARGKAQLDDLPGLWDQAVGALLAPAGQPAEFVQDAREVILAILLIEGDAGDQTDVRRLEDVSGGFLAFRWNLQRVERAYGHREWEGYTRDVHDALDPLRALGMLNDNRATKTREPWAISLTEVGKSAAAIALRERLAPAS